MIQLEMLLNVIFVSGGEGSCPAALTASMPNKMEALSDTCLQIPYSAPAPSIQTLQEGPLTEGSRVTFTCRAIAPCPTQPPHLSWIQSGGPEGRPEPHGDQEPNVRTRRLNITLSDRHDGVRLTCLVEYPVNDPAGGPSNRTAESVVTLNVFYSPKDTQASVSTPTVSLGSVVNLTCTSRANPPVLRFTWFRSSAEGPLNVSDGSLYSFNVSSYREIYYCVATNPLGNQTSEEIKLTISGLNVPLIVRFFGTVFFIGLVISVLWSLKKPSTRQQNPICKASDKKVEE
ncbi:unnamed protein product [Arctogadus glacialis]